MGRPKASKRKQHHSASPKKTYSTPENIAYYFMAAAGAFVLIFVILGLLGYLKKIF
ncbi:hypothetical protein U14_00782 [Candidatus Moduliflexus flocculans]|uniref:Uncharacterized protein n=1 Tax=Candidatus Moduliflexus flocculans TaxID=1499966 RepID=A0A0S6VR19_9BACT|nr:hypothetical protein U14_00782 [Candidatus Moduliflexus flocculans]